MYDVYSMDIQTSGDATCKSGCSQEHPDLKKNLKKKNFFTNFLIFALYYRNTLELKKKYFNCSTFKQKKKKKKIKKAQNKIW